MLDKILARKKEDLAESKDRVPLEELLGVDLGRPVPSFEAALTRPQINVISEIKYRSPSRGAFSCRLPPQEIGRLYLENGAAAISVLTEEHFFHGDLEFIRAVWEQETGLPLLRKDFIFDAYQLAEARAHGASAFLLIVACLSPGRLQELIRGGQDFQLDALVEVHDAFELETAVESGARIIGVNNRDLRTFQVNLDTSFKLARLLEGETGFVLVSESGIREHVQLVELRDAGFNAFLVGSLLMDSSDPGAGLRKLLQSKASEDREKELQRSLRT
jgi:indole-3-glycerol phosphate synthase